VTSAKTGMKTCSGVNPKTGKTRIPTWQFLIGARLKIKYLLILFLLTGCASTGWQAECADDALIAAQMFQRRLGYPTFIVKSKEGEHAQAYALIDGERVWIHMFPFFRWGVHTSKRDRMFGGEGMTYTIDEFIKGHGPWRVK